MRVPTFLCFAGKWRVGSHSLSLGPACRHTSSSLHDHLPCFLWYSSKWMREQHMGIQNASYGPKHCLHIGWIRYDHGLHGSCFSILVSLGSTFPYCISFVQITDWSIEQPRLVSQVLVDTSSTMRGSRRVRVKQAMRTVLRSLPQGVWVNFGGWKSWARKRLENT